MLASFARESPHRASFTARRGSMTTGTRLGPYEIAGSLEAGGMMR